MGSDSCGKPIPAFKTLGSRYHLISSVEVTPEAVLRKRVLSLKPDLEAAGPATIICGLPCLDMCGTPAALTPPT